MPPEDNDPDRKRAKPPVAGLDFSLSGIHPPFDQAHPLHDQRAVLRIDAAQHSGPLPAPEDFRRYKEVEPKAPGLILDMAERQQKHDIWMDKVTLISETIYRVFGILAATGVVGGMVTGSVVCALNNQPAAAVALGTASGLAAVAGVFIRGRNLTRMQAQPEVPPRRTETRDDA